MLQDLFGHSERKGDTRFRVPDPPWVVLQRSGLYRQVEGVVEDVPRVCAQPITRTPELTRLSQRGVYASKSQPMHQAAFLQTSIHGINKSPDLLFKYSTRRARPHTTSIRSSSSATRSSSPPLPHGRECNVSLELPPSGPLLRLCDVRAPLDATGQCRDVTLARTPASPGSRSL